MKKLIIVCLVALLLFTLSTAAFGLNTPAVTQGDGVITGRFVTKDVGLLIGAEYGLTSQLGVFGEFGKNLTNRVGVKYEINPSLAAQGGFVIGDNTLAFVGVDGAMSFSKVLTGIGEANVIFGNGTVIEYELGVKYNLNKQFDINGGIIGVTGDGSYTAFQIGGGYKF
jgi:hypothetical protein